MIRMWQIKIVRPSGEIEMIDGTGKANKERTLRGVARLSLDKANEVAQDLYDEVIRQQTGRPIIVREYA